MIDTLKMAQWKLELGGFNMRSTTATIEALRKSVGKNLSREEFDEMITEIQADAITRTGNKYAMVHSGFGDPYDEYTYLCCKSVSQLVRDGTYVMTVSGWGLSGTDDPKFYNPNEIDD